MIIRQYQESDAGAIVSLFTETVRRVNIQDYTPEQVEVWAPRNPDMGRWNDRLRRSMTFIAEEKSEIIGFGQLESNGHIDCFYVAFNHVHTGVGTRLLETIDQKCQELGIVRMFTEASITAKPFFERRGFRVIKENALFMENVKFVNHTMEKNLQHSMV